MDNIALDTIVTMMLASEDEDLLQLLSTHIDGLANPLSENKLFSRTENPQGQRLARHTVKVCCKVAEKTVDPACEQEHNQLVASFANAAKVAAFLHNKKSMPTKALTQFLIKLLSPRANRPISLQMAACEAAAQFAVLCMPHLSRDTLSVVCAKLRELAEEQTDAECAAVVTRACDELFNSVDTTVTGVQRTVHVKNIDTHVTELELLKVLQECGHVVRMRLCGDRSSKVISAFFMFKTKGGADAMLAKNGERVGRYRLCVLKATSPLKDNRHQGVALLSNDSPLCETSVEITPWGGKSRHDKHAKPVAWASDVSSLDSSTRSTPKHADTPLAAASPLLQTTPQTATAAVGFGAIPPMAAIHPNFVLQSAVPQFLVPASFAHQGGLNVFPGSVTAPYPWPLHQGLVSIS